MRPSVVRTRAFVGFKTNASPARAGLPPRAVGRRAHHVLSLLAPVAMDEHEHPAETHAQPLEAQRSALAHHFAALAHSAAAIARVLDPAVKLTGLRAKKGGKEDDGAPKAKKLPTAYTRRAAGGCCGRWRARIDAAPTTQLYGRPHARLQAGGTSCASRGHWAMLPPLGPAAARGGRRAPLAGAASGAAARQALRGAVTGVWERAAFVFLGEGASPPRPRWLTPSGAQHPDMPQKDRFKALAAEARPRRSAHATRFKGALADRCASGSTTLPTPSPPPRLPRPSRRRRPR